MAQRRTLANFRGVDSIRGLSDHSALTAPLESALSCLCLFSIAKSQRYLDDQRTGHLYS